MTLEVTREVPGVSIAQSLSLPFSRTVLPHILLVWAQTKLRIPGSTGIVHINYQISHVSQGYQGKSWYTNEIAALYAGTRHVGATRMHTQKTHFELRTE